MKERYNKILALLSKHGKTSVGRLSEMLHVSEVTIRQDLTRLENDGLLKRVHGGAVLRDADDISVRLGFNYGKKRRIAHRAAQFINDGDTILIESGSVNALLARELSQKENLTIVTTNVFIAQQLRKNRQSKIIIPGGIYQQDSQSMVGELTKKFLESLHFHKAFIGIDGFTASTGFTSKDMNRAGISGYIVSKAGEVFVVTDSTKFGQTGLMRICGPCDVDHIITDLDLNAAFKQYFLKQAIDLILT